MKTRKVLALAGLATLALVFASAAHAGTVTGSLWQVPEAVAQNAIPANVPAAPPDVTFNVNTPLNFNATSATRASWLASGSAFNIVENTAGTLASLMDNGTKGTLIQFTGLVTVTNGQTFTVAHDDGLTLIIGSTNLGFNSGPTAPTVSTATYTGPSGTFSFQLVYEECCGGPAVLNVDLPFINNPVPEPASCVLLASGFAGLVGYGWRQRQKMP